MVGVIFVVWIERGNLAGTGSRKTGRRTMRDSKYRGCCEEFCSIRREITILADKGSLLDEIVAEAEVKLGVTFLSLSFFSCRMGTMRPTWQDVMRIMCKELALVLAVLIMLNSLGLEAAVPATIAINSSVN